MLTPVPPVTPASVVRPFAGAAHDWLPAHRGTDLAARPGQAVVAPLTGRVVFVGTIAGRPVVSIRTPIARFTLEPVSAKDVDGRWVRTGQVIGRVAEGGHCSGLCLHWGAKVNGQYVDPMTFVNRRAPVLKPLQAATTRSEPGARAGPAAPCCGSGSRDSP